MKSGLVRYACAMTEPDCGWCRQTSFTANGSVASDTHDVGNGLSDPLGSGLDVAVPEMGVAERHADVGVAEEGARPRGA